MLPRALLFAAALAAFLVPLSAQDDGEARLIERATAIHERVITLDTHDDIDPANFTRECNYTQRLATQVDLPKMRQGGLDVAFFIAYVGQGSLTPEGYANAYRQAIEKFEAVHRLTKEIAPAEIELALTAADVPRIAKTGKKVAVIGVENGYPIGNDISRVKEFYDRGGRYMSLAHNGHNQLSDSNTGEADGTAPNNGVSSLGRQVIAEMNRLGMMVDVSHPSKASMMQAAQLSRAPVIASHSAIRAIANHSRNMDDEQLLALKKNGGVIQIVAFNGYVRAEPAQRTRSRAAAMTALRQEFNLVAAPAPTGATRSCPREGLEAPLTGFDAAVAVLPPVRRLDYDDRLWDIQSQYPAQPRANVRDFVDHIDYAVKLIGLDHVGISSDFDGGGGINGWNNAAESLNVTIELVRRGYTEDQIGKLWSGNLLRVWSENERIARAIQAGR